MQERQLGARAAVRHGREVHDARDVEVERDLVLVALLHDARIVLREVDRLLAHGDGTSAVVVEVRQPRGDDRHVFRRRRRIDPAPRLRPRPLLARHVPEAAGRHLLESVARKVVVALEHERAEVLADALQLEAALLHGELIFFRRASGRRRKRIPRLRARVAGEPDRRHRRRRFDRLQKLPVQRDAIGVLAVPHDLELVRALGGLAERVLRGDELVDLLRLVSAPMADRRHRVHPEPRTRRRQHAVADRRLDGRLHELAALEHAILGFAGNVAGTEGDPLGLLVAVHEFERAPDRLRRLRRAAERRTETNREVLSRQVRGNVLAGLHRRAERGVPRRRRFLPQLRNRLLQVAALVGDGPPVRHHQPVEPEVRLLGRRHEVPADKRLRGESSRAVGDVLAAAHRPAGCGAVRHRDRRRIPRPVARLAVSVEETGHALLRSGRLRAAFEERALLAHRQEPRLGILRVAEVELQPELPRRVLRVKAESERQRPVLRLRRHADREEPLVAADAVRGREVQHQDAVPRLLDARARIEKRGAVGEMIHLVEMDDPLAGKTVQRHRCNQQPQHTQLLLSLPRKTSRAFKDNAQTAARFIITFPLQSPRPQPF